MDKPDIFKLLRENEEKLRDGTVEKCYKKIKPYFDTPSLEIIIKERLIRLAKLKNKYKEI